MIAMLLNNDKFDLVEALVDFSFTRSGSTSPSEVGLVYAAAQGHASAFASTSASAVLSLS